jgi:hypothetical protein
VSSREAILNSQHITLDWYIPDRVVLVTFAGDITRDDLLDVDEVLLHDFFDATPAENVHVIFDNTQASSLPEVSIHKQLQFVDHPKLGWSVSHGDSPLTRFFLSSVAQLTGIKFRTCQSMDQCVNFLLDMDPALAVDFPLSP